MKFSVIVVCLNPGEKLNQTLDSILKQTWDDYEIIVKDGMSSDGSIEKMRRDERIRFFAAKDRGIYDAMNQAAEQAEGDFILFLNCGDVFYHERVLEEAAACAEREPQRDRLVLYGNTYSEKSQVLISSPPEITGFSCYRNIPCHQSCFYSTKLCKEKPYNQEYRIRADYDHFLWCFYKAKAKMVYMNLTVASYEGGGYSESRENRKRDKREHREITAAYMKKGELFRYRFMMLVTLAPLRRILAESALFAGGYHRLKERIYGSSRER